MSLLGLDLVKYALSAALFLDLRPQVQLHNPYTQPVEIGAGFLSCAYSEVHAVHGRCGTGGGGSRNPCGG